MVTLRPVRRALVPVDSAAAAAISAPNYDEFQGDDEIRAVIDGQPESVLQVTMAHCSPRADGPIDEGSPASLALAGANMKHLIESPLTRVVEDVVWVYELVDPRRSGVRQLGLGGMARIDEIRTPENPKGTIIRNEGIRPKKAQGRADLIVATDAFIGTVNNAVDDESGALTEAMAAHADAREPDFHAVAEDGVDHRVWLVTAKDEVEKLCGLLAAEPHAYVADGNHRSAAAAILGFEGFVSVFFPVHTMGLAPYSRLVSVDAFDLEELLIALKPSFEIEPRDDAAPFQPTEVHQLGLYADGQWFTLRPRAGAYDPQNAVQCIDADIVQRTFFSAVLGIEDAADNRLTFVGGNKDAKWLAGRVDAGHHDFALTLAPVTVQQFVDVCLQNRIMPPKSTWFQPKIRSGLVMALLG